MIPTTFLAVLAALDMVIARPSPTSPESPQGHNAFLFWDPPTAYKSQQARRLYWEEICGQALAREGCDVGMIHRGQSKVITPDGGKIPYINVEAAPLMDMENTTRLRVFKDGSSTTGWSGSDRTLITASKLSKKEIQPLLGPQSWKGPTANLSWDPPHAYKKQQKRKLHWEQKCDPVLVSEGCRAGIIHQSESKEIRNGKKTPYIKLEGAPSVGLEYGKKMRVFLDGSYEHGWSERDQKLVSHAKRLREPDRRRDKKRKGVEETSDRSQLPSEENTEGHPKYRVSWDTPDAYPGVPLLREAYEKACIKAIARERCDFAIMAQGKHRLESPKGTKSWYINVSVGNDADPDNLRYMRVFEDGSSQWYDPSLGQPWKRRWINPQPDAPRERRRRRTRKGTTSSTHAFMPPPYQTSYPERFEDSGGDEHQDPGARPRV